MATDPRSTRAWKKARHTLRTTQPNTCHLCGLPIPQHVDHQRHPLGYTVDHIDTIHAGGNLTDPRNLAPAHRTCNSRRNKRPLTPQVYAECRAAMGQPTNTPSRNW